MNQLPEAKVAAVKRLLAIGASVRAIAAAVGCTHNTVCRYSKMYRYGGTCGCGKPLGHNGWCHVRLAFSPVRGGWLAKKWVARKSSELTAAVDRVVTAAKAKGHTLGPFIWAGSQAASAAYAVCKVCGKQVRVFPAKAQWERYRDWQQHAGTAVRDRCKTPEQRAAEAAITQEKRAWQSGKRMLRELKRELRNRSHSQSEVFTPDQSSPR